MRTTVSISDELLAAAKQRAREHGQTLGQVVDAALQRELSDARAADDAPRVPVFTGGTGIRPGVDLGSNRAVAEALDGETDPGAESAVAQAPEEATHEPTESGSNGAVAQAPDEGADEATDQEPDEATDGEPDEAAGEATDAEPDPGAAQAVAQAPGEGADHDHGH